MVARTLQTLHGASDIERGDRNSCSGCRPVLPARAPLHQRDHTGCQDLEQVTTADGRRWCLFGGHTFRRSAMA